MLTMDAKKIKSIFKMIVDVRNITLFFFLLFALSLTWSTAKTIRKNKLLEADIAHLQAEVEIKELENKVAQLNNEYYKTDSFLELEARRKLNKALPGEKLVILPKHTVEELTVTETEDELFHTNTPMENARDWLYYLAPSLRKN